MKTKFTILLFFMCGAFLSSKAQEVPNGSFSSWTNGTPTGWNDIDQWLAAQTLTGYTLVSEDTASADVVKGCYASAKLETELVDGQFNLTALLSLGAFTINGTTGAIAFSGVPYAYRPDSVSFQYKYVLVGPDTAQYGFFFSKWNGTSEDLVGGIPAGYVNFITDTTSTFRKLTLSPEYQLSETPDSFGIYFISGGNNSTPGNTLWIDTVEMIFNGGVPTDVKNLSVQTNVTLSPVPAINTLHVNVSEAMLNKAFAIVDLSGQVVSRGIIQSVNGTQQVSYLAAGTYIYTILDENDKPINQAKFVVVK